MEEIKLRKMKAKLYEAKKRLEKTYKKLGREIDEVKRLEDQLTSL